VTHRGGRQERAGALGQAVERGSHPRQHGPRPASSTGRRAPWSRSASPPWPLQPAAAQIDSNTMTAPHGIELRGAARQDRRDLAAGAG
jgi:hypothetical protein